MKRSDSESSNGFFFADLPKSDSDEESESETIAAAFARMPMRRPLVAQHTMRTIEDFRLHEEFKKMAKRGAEQASHYLEFMKDLPKTTPLWKRPSRELEYAIGHGCGKASMGLHVIFQVICGGYAGNPRSNGFWVAQIGVLNENIYGPPFIILKDGYDNDRGRSVVPTSAISEYVVGHNK